MTAPSHLPGWYPLMRARALNGAAALRTLAGADLRLSRGPDGAPVAADVRTGEHRPAAEADGWIFAALGGAPARLPARPLLAAPFRALHIEGRVEAGLADVGENILDTTHTSVVHSHYLRRPGARRAVEATLASGDGWASATYPPGAAPGGWGARLLGAHRYTITDTFCAPSIAEVTYTELEAPVFAARFWLTPVSASDTFVAATVAVPGGGWVARAKLAALRVFFLRIFAEDRAILEMIAANRLAHGGAPLVFTPQDLLRPGINAILEGRRPPPANARIALKV
ncbi:hypothetical protein [Hyphomonas sp.]|uniref:hypothetical protein n=1 Tax=Hyphomonas sp. TaxID=87 RepID=UPI00391BE15C